MFDIIMTITVLTVGITALAIMGSKMVQEIKQYHEIKAKAEKREQERLANIAWIATHGRA